ncbi:MAG: TonB-dependent receptor [Bacteroidetes bacterium]|nr:TonB-dependent receptor [Bacteroidota bacterium]
MMKKFVLIILLLCSAYLLSSQTIKVVNKNNFKPIENVAVFNLDHTKTILSNTNGEANLENFNKNDTLIFQHTSYIELIIPFESIYKYNYLIKLTEKSVNLSEIVVSASKWEQNKNEVPNRITTISAKEIAFNNPQTSADLLGNSNEVFIQKSQLGGGSPMIRGFAANSILLVVDGVRMNNAIYRSGNLQNIITLDPNIIESAEVIFGPGTIIYGSDALGGVMDFHTKNIKLSHNNKSKILANALTRYSTASNEKTGHFDINFGRKKWGFLSSVSYSDFDDLRMGTIHNDEFERKEYVTQINGLDSIVKNSNVNIQKFSGYSQINLMQKIRYRPSEKIDFIYSFFYSNTSDIPRYDRLIQYSDGYLKYAKWYYGPQKWMMHDLKIFINDTTKIFDNAQITLAFQDVEESRNDRKYRKSDLRIRTEKVNAYSVNFDFYKKIKKKSILFYGVEAVYNKVNSTGVKKNIETGEVSPTSSRYPDGGSTYTTFAGYISFKSNISEKITFSTGLRYSYVILHSKFIDKSFFDFPFNKIDINTGALNGSLGLVYRPSETWQFNINASSGFRAPNLDDVAKVFDSEPGNVVVPNENLKPEYAYNIDVGLIKNISDKTEIKATVFYTYLIDAMVRRDFLFNDSSYIWYDSVYSKVEAVVNTGKAYIYGGSVSCNSDISNHFTFRTNLTYTHGVDEEDIPLRHVAPLFGSTAIGYKTEKFRVELFAIYNGKISYKNLSFSERNKAYLYAKDADGNPYSPSWWTMNIKASVKLNPVIELDAGIENLLNYRYRPYSSGICAPGRNFIIAIRGSF